MADGDSQANGVRSTRHGTVMVGELPSGFLQVSSNMQDQVARDEQIAQQINAQQFQQSMVQQQVAIADRLFVSVLEAKLNKNYGIVKMDPYCRLRIGHQIYETDTAHGGSKNPRWTKSISTPYSVENQTIYLEIFDERSMSTDCRIAWTDITLPDKVKNGEPVDDWWPLDGKLGPELEGTVHLLVSKKKVQQTINRPMPVFQPSYGAPVAVPYVPNAAYPAGSSGYLPQASHPPGGAQAQPGPMFTDDDVKTVKELFPDVEDDVIKAVLEASRGNKDAAINSLLSMQ